jgi:hypothetical protein
MGWIGKNEASSFEKRHSVEPIRRLATGTEMERSGFFGNDKSIHWVAIAGPPGSAIAGLAWPFFQKNWNFR